MSEQAQIIDLLNRRFDDLNDKVDEMKQDLVARQLKHEDIDKDEFKQIRAEIEPLKKLKYSISGALGLVMVIVELLKAYLQHK